MHLVPPNSRWAKTLSLAAVFAFAILMYLSAQSLRKWRLTHTISLNALSKGFKVDGNGFLSLPDADRYCQAHNWAVYPERKSRRKIYDLFMMNGELDWLEIRLNELKDEVDYFVILESETTFTGIPKPLHMKENWAQYAAFHDKIIYEVLNDTGFASNITWDHEDLQRNAMFDQVFPQLQGTAAQANLGDVILVSDIDEVPRPETLRVLRNCDFSRRVTLRSQFYYYGFQWLHRGEDWPHPQATFYEGEKTIRPADLRNGEGGNILLAKLDKTELWNAAWHCSSCFATLEEMLNKLSSFSHTRLNQPEFRNHAGIVDRVRNGLDLFDREAQFYDRVDSNTDVPEYLKVNREKFSYLLDRDPPNANFKDYTIESKTD